MPILDSLRLLNHEQGQLNKRKETLLKEFVENGGRWEELAFINKIWAIQVYKMENKGVSFVDAKSYIDAWIANRE